MKLNNRIYSTSPTLPQKMKKTKLQGIFPKESLKCVHVNNAYMVNISNFESKKEMYFMYAVTLL